MKNDQCLKGVGNKVNGLLNTLRGTENQLEKKWDELKKCGDLYLCQAKQCAYGFTGGSFSACKSAAGQCGTRMGECGEWSYTCEKQSVRWVNGACNRRACENVSRKVCPIPWICNWVTKQVCNGVCTGWEQVAEPFTETLVTAGSCVGGGFVAVAEKTKCLRHLPLCTAVGGCYIGQGAVSAASCAG